MKYAPATYTPVHAEYNPASGTYRITELTNGTKTLGANRYVGYFFIKETNQVFWEVTNQDAPSDVYNEYGTFDDTVLKHGNTYNVNATYTTPDETTEKISFTVTVIGSGLEM